MGILAVLFYITISVVIVLGMLFMAATSDHSNF
jgi:hypothetical protein